jgi:type IX secretion system PorP/SprF family membrane protein
MRCWHKYIVTVVALLGGTVANRQYTFAQINPMGTSYFQNQYLINPAMAGFEKGLNINLGYRKQWNNLPGGPTVQTMTGDYRFNEKVGIGLNIYSDKAGLFKRTRAVVSYAYHLPLNLENEHLSFGLSLGAMSERISEEDINGDPGDANVSNYNERETYVDGDFGMAYTSNTFNLQLSLPNMKELLKQDENKNTVDRAIFFSSTSYKFRFSEVIGIEPKVCYRGVNGFDNILDAGINLYANRVNFFGMYHSSQSATYGLGFIYQSISFNGIYTTTMSALSGYTNGNFEINLRLRLGK